MSPHRDVGRVPPTGDLRQCPQPLRQQHILSDWDRSRNHEPMSRAQPWHQSHRQSDHWPRDPGLDKCQVYRQAAVTWPRPHLSITDQTQTQWPDPDCGECEGSLEPGFTPACYLLPHDRAVVIKLGTCQELDYNIIFIQDLPRSQHPPDSDPWQFLSAGQDHSVSETQLRW